MINVLVVNNNKSENNDWSIRLKSSGYGISSCTDLTEMVSILTRDKIHIVICSANLIDRNAFPVLNLSATFFPRVKIVIVGRPPGAYLLGNLSNIAGTQNFSTDMEKYYTKPRTDVSASTSVVNNLTLVLNDHFLSGEEAATMLTRAKPKFLPGCTVICVKSDSCFNPIYQIALSNIRNTDTAHVLHLNPDEVYIIISGASSKEACIGIANNLRLSILKETDAMFSIGVSRRRAAASELYACRKEAARAAAATHIYGINSTIHIDYLDSCELAYLYPKHKEKRMIEQTVDGNRDEAVNMLDQIFDVIKACDNVKQSHINKIALGIMVGLNIAAVERAGSFDKAQMDAMSTGQLLSAKSADDTYASLKQGIMDFADEMDNITDIRRDILFLEITKLKARKGELTISELTNAFQTTLCFLNTSVSKNCGMSIFRFANEQ